MSVEALCEDEMRFASILGSLLGRGLEREVDLPVAFLDLILAGGRGDAESVVKLCFGDHFGLIRCFLFGLEGYFAGRCVQGLKR